MDFRCRQKDVNATFLPGGLHRLAGGIDVLGHATCEATNDRAFDFLSDGFNGGEVTITNHREAGLDHINFETRELAGDLEFFSQVHGSPGALLPVAQCCVKDDDSLVFHNCSFYSTV